MNPCDLLPEEISDGLHLRIGELESDEVDELEYVRESEWCFKNIAMTDEAKRCRFGSENIPLVKSTGLAAAIVERQHRNRLQPGAVRNTAGIGPPGGAVILRGTKRAAVHSSNRDVSADNRAGTDR